MAFYRPREFVQRSPGDLVPATLVEVQEVEKRDKSGTYMRAAFVSEDGERFSSALSDALAVSLDHFAAVVGGGVVLLVTRLQRGYPDYICVGLRDGDAT